MGHATHLSTGLIACALAADLLFGDPEWLPHPVRLIGAAIARGERAMRPWRGLSGLVGGAILSAAVIGLAAITTWGLVTAADRFNPLAGAAVAVAIAWTTLALRSLDQAALAVQQALEMGDDEASRSALPALVGRDPLALDRDGIVRATVESVAENLSDGVIAPLLFLFIAGPVGGVAYKAINTLDSMIGYRSERYLYFGRAAARLDDLANWIPARLSAACLAGAAQLLLCTGHAAIAACARDAFKHESPNAGWPEAAMAGALGVALGGDAVYGGEIVRRATLGDAKNPLTPATIATARNLLRPATAIAFITFAAVRYAYSI